MAVRSTRRALVLPIALSAFVLSTSGCGRGDPNGAAKSHEPMPLASQEGAVCGMLIREQPAPRAQIVYRDASRSFFCSLGDMLVHLSAPSPNGRPEAVFVEVMDPSEDPLETHTGPHPWLSAEAAAYVVGVPRKGLMGEPVLTYASRAEASAVAQRYDEARVLDLAGLQGWWSAQGSGGAH